MATGSGIDAQVGYADEIYQNEVQSLAITGIPTGGTMLPTFDGASIGPVNYNCTFGQMQAAFDASPIGAGQVVCAGGPWPGTPITVTFSGPNVAKRGQPDIAIGTNALTGGTTPTMVVTAPTPGSGYGDFVTPNKFTEFVDVGVAANVSFIVSKARRAGQKLAVRSDRSQAQVIGADGDLSVEGVTKSLGFWLKHMMGAPVITTPPGGTNTRDHTFTITDLWNMSFTLQAGIPMAADIPAVQPFTWVGCKIPTWEIGCDKDGVVDLKIGVDAKDEDTSRSLAVASYPSGLELLTWVGAYMTMDGRNADGMKFSLSKGKNLDTDRRFANRNNHKKREPILNDATDLKGALENEFHDMWAYYKFIAGTPISMVAVFEGPSVIEAAYKPMLQITMPTVRFDKAAAELQGVDVTKQPLPYVVEQPADGSQPLTIVYRTTDLTS